MTGGEAIERRLEGLSRQEMRILFYLKDRCLNRQIAEALNIRESTAKAHVSTILQKPDLSSRTQAALLAQHLLSTSDS